MATAPHPDEARQNDDDQSDHVIELMYCESRKLILHPGQLY